MARLILLNRQGLGVLFSCYLAGFTFIIYSMNVHYIKSLLRERGITYPEAAEGIGFSESYLKQVLNGHKNGSRRFTQKLAEYLNVPFQKLLDDTEKLYADYVNELLLQQIHAPVQADTFKELLAQVELGKQFGMFNKPDEVKSGTHTAIDYWKKDTILPFRSDNCVAFWEFEGDEILIRGPARCGKSTLILEYAISQMVKHNGIQILVARAFSVDLDAVRQNIKDICKYRFSDPLSPIDVSGGSTFNTIRIGDSEMHLKGIDRSEGQLGAGYDMVIFSQAEQIKKENIDIISSRCTPASENWVEDGKPRSMIIYDANPNRLDHWLEVAISQNGLKKIDFNFPDHPAYYDEEGNETDLFKQVYSRLDRMEGVWRQRLLEGKAANPEGTIFELQPCHILTELPSDFHTTHLFYRGFDFGMKDPSVCLWFGVHRQTADVIVFREWRRVGIDTIQMGEQVKTHSKEKVLMTVIDNDENLQNILRKHTGIPTTLAQKGPNSIASGITLIQHKLKNAIDGVDGGLYFYNDPVVRDPQLVKDNAPLTILDEAELYAWQENKDQPIDKHNHGWDIVRYVLDYLETRKAGVGFASGAASRKTVL